MRQPFAVDGRIARLTHSVSKFGEEYDSLVDMVSFGIAPALMIYLSSLQLFGRWGWLAAFLFVICVALRLAAGIGAPPPNDLGADIAGALPALGRVAVSGRLGRPSEWLLTGERGTVVVRRIGPLERFLVFRVGAGEWVGRARYAARAFAERIQTLLPAP